MLCLLLTLLVSAPAGAQENNQPPEGFESLFNGKDFAGWTGGTTRNPAKIAALPPEAAKKWREQMEAGVAKHWRVEDGQIVNDGHEPHLITDRDYRDFEFWVDWKLSPKGDSGIYLRGCPQVQIWDPTNKAAHPHGADKGSGGLWNNKKQGRDPSALADKPIGQWNRMYIRMVGPYVTVILNGKTVVENVPLENYYDRKSPPPMSGPIHLQTHGSETRFRNLFVREIPEEEANTLLAEIHGGDEGFVNLFNGKDFTGWTGGVKAYEIVDGELWANGKHGGNLIAETAYGDFIARFDFVLSPGSNNGVIIRTPSANVTPASAGLELQILDDSAKRYEKLKPYQFHGSIYGIQPAIRGYLRPVGQWNTQEVHVVGDHIQVYLNGYLIVDAHLDKVATKHKGAKRRSGYFGFTSHTSRVGFRNIKIKRIEAEDK